MGLRGCWVGHIPDAKRMTISPLRPAQKRSPRRFGRQSRKPLAQCPAASLESTCCYGDCGAVRRTGMRGYGQSNGCHIPFLWVQRWGVNTRPDGKSLRTCRADLRRFTPRRSVTAAGIQIWAPAGMVIMPSGIPARANECGSTAPSMRSRPLGSCDRITPAGIEDGAGTVAELKIVTGRVQPAMPLARFHPAARCW